MAARAQDSTMAAVPDTTFDSKIKGPSHRYSPLVGQRKRSPLAELRVNDDKVTITRDSSGTYRIVRDVFGRRLGVPAVYPFDAFASARLQSATMDNWSKLVLEAQRRNETQRGLLDFKVNIPGGQRSAFTTIFGKPEVNLRVTGQANMNIGASIQETRDPAVPPDQQKRVDPTFEQNLKLNIQGTIGDKLTIRTDWDTERSFNYQNQLKITYRGYEDEIIQSIELGNVSMDTGNSLVRGGGALFGMKSTAKMGPLEFTGILSQQEGRGGSQTLTGGAQETKIDLRPNAYDSDRHFFIDFFALQEFEGNMSDPTLIRRLFSMVNVEVWVQNETLAPMEGQRTAAALLDLGVTDNAGFYTFPDEANDRFNPAVFEQFRDPSRGISATDFGVQSDEFADGFFVPLRPGQDYEIDENLGILSLRQRLNPRQALAISFSYRTLSNQIIYVGDVNLGDNSRLFLKLLRPSSYTPSSRSWPLTLRNVYSLGTSNVSRENLQLDVYLTQGSTEQTNFPGLANILLQDLGLDRVGSQGQIGADNQIDFGTGTLNPRDGRILFPYLEPFGQRIIDIINASNLTDAEKQTAIAQYSFRSLYTNTQSNASNISQNNLFKIKGTNKGGVSDSYFLGMALVQGSVRVTANGRTLNEGVDYQVDYSLGNITITNRAFLAPGQEIKIDYESNNVFKIQQTTFAGLRAQYTVNPEVSFGSTIFTQKDRPMQDKIPIGDEPINNTVIGFDAKGRWDTPWLTRAIDRVPLLQTKTMSNFSFTGEFAQIRPGVAQTTAVTNAVKRGILYGDEERGVSFIDEFEGSKTSISFLSPGRWKLATAPDAIPGIDPQCFGSSNLPTNCAADQSIPSRILRSDHRGKFAWYTIPISLGRITGASRTVESLPIAVTDVFPDRDVLRQDNIMQTLDVWYDPTTRGPYNYNLDLKNLLEQRPQDLWGGMTAVIPSGLDDLTQNNIEFLEFWVMAILPDGRDPSIQDIADYNGTLLFDIGVISEDVIPNNLNNSEDGIAERSGNLKPDQFGRSYVYNNIPDLDGQFSQESIQLEDAGLDGARNTGGIDGTGEDVLFTNFLQQMAIQYAGTDMLSRIQADPSNDDYVYFDSQSMNDQPLHKRFHRMYAYTEGNALSTNDTRAITNRPDSEGLLNGAVVNLENTYYQYEFKFNPADTTTLRIGSSYIIDKVDRGRQYNTWYQVRIPLREFTRAVGGIENLQRVSHIRMWMTGYRQPFTMRFATLELVGNQWRKDNLVSKVNSPNTVFEVSTINIEENANRRPIPYRIPNGAIRSVQRGQQQDVLANEQSLAMKVEALPQGDLRMIKRSYPLGLNLTNYTNMRMFVHGEGYRQRKDIELVVRIGSDLLNNYYEYRQPVTPSDTLYPYNTSRDRVSNSEDSDQVWLPEENGMNLILSVMNTLKQARNLAGFSPAETYETSDPNILKGAPPGTVVAIRGEPALNRITEIGIGVRNPSEPGRGVSSLDAELWVNELRVSGFEDQSGWAANLRTQLTLADFATLSASFNRSTDGFGSLESKLGERNQFDQTGFDVSTTLNLHRFIPDRFGWNIPLSLSARQSLRTPRYLPRQGDLTFVSFRQAVLASDSLTSAEKDDIIQSQLSEIQDFSESYSFNLTNVSKRFSKSKLGQLTLDNTRFSYVYNTAARRDFQVRRNDNWNYTTSVNYQLTNRNVKTVKPLYWLDEVPVLGILSGAEFAYLPASVNASGTLNRTYSDNERRAFNTTPSLLTQNHSFRYNSAFGFTYNIMPPLAMTFGNTISNDLTTLAQDSIPGTKFYELKDSYTVLSNMFTSDSLRPRRSEYAENYSLNWRPRINRFPSLTWLTYNASYRGGFRWQNTPLGSNRGANLQNQYQLDHNPGIRVQDLMKKMDWYDAMLKADDAARRQRETERTRLRQQREREKLAREQAAQSSSTPTAEPQAGQAIGRGGAPQPPPQANAQPVTKTKRSFSEQLTFWSRRSLLASTSFQSFDMTWSHTVGSTQAGYAGTSSLWDSFNTENDASYSPGLGYRVGLSSRIPQSQLIRSTNPNLTIPLSQGASVQDNLTFRSVMQPTREISVNLDWNLTFDDKTTNTLNAGVTDITSQRTQNGSVAATVWVFGSGYADLFRRQLGTAFDDIGSATNVNDADGNGDGKTVLSSRTLMDDFRNAYLGFSGKSALGSKGFIPMPLPNWRLTWSGLEKYVPWAATYVQRITLSHTYVGRYQLGWIYNPDAGTDQTRTLGSYRITDERPEFMPNSINLTQNFNPLVGMQISWKNGLTTDIQYASSTVTSFSLSNTTVTEKLSNGLKFTARYNKRGFQLPFFPRLQNTFNASLGINYIEDLTNTYRLNSDLQDVLSVGPNDLVKDVNLYRPGKPNERGNIRIQVTPLIGYQFSQTVNMNFEYRYDRLIPKSTGVFPRTNQDFRLNIVVSIRS
jgi:cell surface protein SprA